MFDGLFQPMHILILLMLLLVPAVLVIRLLWRLGSRKDTR